MEKKSKAPRLFVTELGAPRIQTGLRAGKKKTVFTTLALGEEDPQPTTLAIGEEDPITK